MYVDWEYYKIFYYVAKYQNFTKAARVLGNNQPNITHSMNRLESQLNCVLFIRSNRGVTLTPEGELLYSRIASAAVQIQDAEEELSASATLEHGAISISATETALNIYLAEKLRAFHTDYPGIRLRISNHSTPQALQAVKNGEVDFAVITTPAEVESGLKMVELKPFYEVLVGGRTFTALASQNLSLKELNNYPLISLSDESMTRAFYRQFFLDHGAVLKPDTEAATTDQMIVHLGSLFRHNLRTKRQQITLEEELDGLEDYIYLQQMRFDGRITVEKSIRVQPAAVLVPSFMLQPVVENAYSHGLKSCEEGGRILLRAWMQGKVLVLTVADNGKGMTPEELDAVQAKIVQSEQTGRSIGLGNISRRIGMLYPGGKMQVYSRAGHGTVVRFELPQTQQPEEKEETPS